MALWPGPACRAAFRNSSLRTPLVFRRALAAPSSGTFSYQTSEAGGVKLASRDLAGPTTTLALVAKAGTRYQPLPGLAEGLEKFAFRTTERRSPLRIVRESELFGATLFSSHTRESVIIGAKFFRDDLPYYVELLGEVATLTEYKGSFKFQGEHHEFVEQVMEQIHEAQRHQLGKVNELALASAHGLAFHRGLGEPVHPTSSSPLTKYLSAEAIGAYSTLAYVKPNVALVANGAEHSELSKWAGEYISNLRTQPMEGVPELVETEQTKYYGGEERIAHAKGNAMVLAFPGSSSLTGGFYKPEIAVLAALLGGRSSIKWTSGFSLLAKIAGQRPGLHINTGSSIYSDAGLLHTTITGPAPAVAEAAAETVSTIKKIAAGEISTEDIKKARAVAQFKELEYGQENMAGLELTGAGLVQTGRPYQLDESAEKIRNVSDTQVREAAKALLDFKASVSTVGDLFQLPYADEIGLMV
ncbi:MAG: hypothetical protein Q9162_003991 [Coniocarpon cinnabarinum]